jgi:hypothetical protein
LKYFLFKSFRVFALKDLAIGTHFQLLTTAICYGFLFWQMKLELINLKKQTANGLRTSSNKATPNSLDRYAPLLKIKNMTDK